MICEALPLKKDEYTSTAKKPDELSVRKLKVLNEKILSLRSHLRMIDDMLTQPHTKSGRDSCGSFELISMRTQRVLGSV